MKRSHVINTSHSLRNKILILILPLLVLIYLIFTGANVWQTYRYLQDDLTDRLENIVKINAEVLAKPLWNFDLEYVSLSLESLLLDTDVLGAQVLDEYGKALLSIGCVTCKDTTFTMSPLTRDIEFKSFRGSIKVGQLVIHPSTSRIKTGVQQEILRTMVMMTIGLTAFAILVMAGYKRTIGTPLERLTRAIKLADEKHIRIPVDWESQDELGQVIESYNHLLVTLANQEEALTRASMMKSAFLANMSHEIRTPMNSILGMTEMLNESSPLSLEQQEYLATLNHSGQTLLQTINDILDISKIESGQMDLESAPFNLRNSVEEACGLIAFKAHKKRLDLALRIHPDLPEAVVGDAGRLRQVLVNLLGNAVKFTNEGSVTLLVDPGKKHSVHFTIQDTGIGISKARQDSIFKMFSQADSSTTRQYGGTGLGLAISKRLVGLMKGSISVVSEAGKGASFTFAVALPPDQKSKPPSSDLLPMKDVHVLLVSPSPIRRLYVSEMLKSWGAVAHPAQNRQDALKMAAKETRFTLIIIDALLPRESREALLADMLPQGYSEHRLPQVIVLTGHDPAASSELGDLPSFCQLQKPIRKAELHRKIKALQTPGKPPRKLERADNANEPPMRILLAEDSEANRDLIKLFLKGMAVELHEAGNGLLALQAIQQHPAFDLVFLDLQMPVMDGFEAARAIRNWLMEQNREQIPLVALTADVRRETREKCMAMGFFSYMTKPIRKGDLLERVAEMADDRHKSEKTPGSRHSFKVNAAFRPLVPKLLQEAEKEFDTILHPLRHGLNLDLEHLLTTAHVFRGTFASYGLAEIAGRLEIMEHELGESGTGAIQGQLNELLDLFRKADITYEEPDGTE